MKQNCSYKPMIVEAMLRRSVLPLLLMFMLFQPLTALARRTMYGRLNTDTQTLTIYYDDNWQKGDFTIPSYSTPYWRYNIASNELAKIKTVVFDPSFKDARLKDCSWWFSGFKGLTTITHLEYLNTSQVTNMQYMFSNCESIETLDLSTFNTENVTNMSNMFYYCKSLKSLNLSSFNTSKVNYMGSMFSDCESLTALNLSSFNTENISDYEYMFFCCKSLTALDLSSFNSKEILNTSCMFTSCIALKTIDLSSFDTSKTNDMSLMFSGCSALETIYASSSFTTDNVTKDSYMFSTCTKLNNYTIYGSGKTHAHIGEGGFFTVAPAWVRFDAATGTLTFQCSSAKTDADTDYFLNEAGDDPGWQTKSASIKTVVFKRNFRDARPTTCSLWFGFCTNLTSIEGLENLNTSDVTRMDYMFYKCEKLRALDLSAFNTEKVTNMNDMFGNCKNLETLNLSSFKTNNLTNMSRMFSECNKIAQLDMSGFNTSGVKALDQVFKNCYALEALDLSSFDTKWVTDMSSLFENCQSLKTIYVSDLFSTFRVKYSTNMFRSCYNLKGATAFADIQEKDKAWAANYTDGYFTKKVGMNGSDIIGATGSKLTVDGLTLSDDKAFELYEACYVQDGSYTRPMASTWGTLCLPYATKPSDRNTCLFYKIETMEVDKVLLTEITGAYILAGTPLVVRKKDDSQTDISIYSEPAKMSTAPSNDHANPLKGTFTTTELSDDCYIIAKNQFRLVENYKVVASGVKVAGFRAYLQPETTAGSKRADVLSIGIDDEATGIESAEVIDWLNNPSAEYYDLKGRRVEGLQKGINIVKVGKRVKKVVINK